MIQCTAAAETCSPAKCNRKTDFQEGKKTNTYQHPLNKRKIFFVGAIRKVYPNQLFLLPPPLQIGRTLRLKMLFFPQ